MSQVKHRKIALMGYPAVGKSSLVIQYVQDEFCHSYAPTIENRFNKKLKVRNEEFELCVLDTAGQDEYSFFPDQIDIDGYVLVYSIDSLRSFQMIQRLYKNIIDMVGNPKLPVVLVGNKVDIAVGKYREVSREEGEKLAKKLKAKFMETSAKDNFCVKDVFESVILQIEQLNGNMESEEKKDGCIIS